MFYSRKPILRLLAIVFGLVLVAAACGNDDDDGPVTAAEEAPATSAPTAAAQEAPASSGDGDAEPSSDSSDTAGADTSDSDAGESPAPTEAPQEESSAPPDADLEARMRVLGAAAPPQWDPVLTVSRCDAPQLSTVYDILVRNTPEGALIPGLAVEWSAPDETTFVLKLRDGVSFHDGTPFNAEAVKAHIDRAKSEELSTLSPVLEMVEDVVVVDNLTVQFNLNQPRAGIMPSILNGRAGMVPSPSAVSAEGEDYGVDNAVGAGPYVYDSHIPDEEAHVNRNPDHWDAGNILLAGIDFLGSASEFQIERIKDGEVDFSTMKDTDLPLAQEAADDGDVEFLITSTVQYGELFIKASVEPFDNILVRQALNHAINRPVAAEFVTGVPGSESYGPIAPTSPAKGVAENPYPYDPDRARQLLAEAGYPDGLDLRVAQIEHAYYTRYAAALQDMLRDSGFNVELYSVVGTEINKALYQRQELDAAFTATLGQGEPGLTLETRYSSTGATNPSGIAPEGFDDLLAESFSNVDSAERAALYAQAEKALMDEALAVPIYHNSGLSVFRPEVKGIGRGYTTCEQGNFLDPIYIAKN